MRLVGVLPRLLVMGQRDQIRSGVVCKFVHNFLNYFPVFFGEGMIRIGILLHGPYISVVFVLVVIPDRRNMICSIKFKFVVHLWNNRAEIPGLNPLRKARLMGIGKRPA